MADTSAENLVVKIEGDDDDYQATLKRVEERTEKTAHFLETAFEKTLDFINESITEVALFLHETWTETGDDIVRITRAARTLGTTTTVLTSLHSAAAESGIGVSQLEGALAKLNRNMGEAASMGSQAINSLERLGSGGSQAVQALRRLNLSLNDMKNLTLNQQLGVLAERVSGIRSTSERSAIGMRLFGSSGAKMAEMLSHGTEKLREAQHEAARVGVTFTTNQGQMVEQAKISINHIFEILEGFKRQVAISLAPVMQVIGDYLTEWSIYLRENVLGVDAIQRAAMWVLDTIAGWRQSLLYVYAIYKSIDATAYKISHGWQESIELEKEAAAAWEAYSKSLEGASPSEKIKAAMTEQKEQRLQVPALRATPEAFTKFENQLKKQLQDLEVEFAGKSRGMSDEEIKRRQEYESLLDTLAESGQAVTYEERNRLGVLYEQLDALEKQKKAQEAAEKAAKAAAKEQERLAKEAQRELEQKQSADAKRAASLLETTLTPIQQLKKELSETTDLVASGALTIQEAVAIDDARVRKFAEANAVSKQSAGTALTFGSAEAEQARLEKPSEDAVKGIYKLVEKAELSIRTEEKILEAMQGAPVPVPVTFPG